LRSRRSSAWHCPPEDWFDLLPRRAARRIGTVLVVVLAVIARTAPSAFQAGARFTDRLLAQAQKRGDQMARYITDYVIPKLPSPSGSPPHR
jgi:hypothetical protein